jgi:hypothetical protein
MTTKPMNAKQYRAQHIAKVEAELKRLAAAVKMLKANTAEIPDWQWTGDWQDLAKQMNEITDNAERAASISQRERSR